MGREVTLLLISLLKQASIWRIWNIQRHFGSSGGLYERIKLYDRYYVPFEYCSRTVL
jgi:hypothetical protein